jgi:hypothetical protein
MFHLPVAAVVFVFSTNIGGILIYYIIITDLNQKQIYSPAKIYIKVGYN